MNTFDKDFFLKYLSEGEEMLFICHRHITYILDKLIIFIFFGVIVPAFFYANNSLGMANMFQFMYFEAYLFLIYFFLVYSIFDWYNDVWIITDKGIIDVNWKMFTSEVVFTSYEDISGIEIHEDSFWDSMMKRGNVIIYLEGQGAEFVLEGAYNPQEVVNYIKEVTSMIQANKVDVSKDVPDLLIDTMKQVVEDYLIRKHEEEHGLIHRDKEYEEILKKAKSKKSTIDLSEEI